MAISEQEQQILDQIEWNEFELPQMKSDAQLEAIGGVVLIATGIATYSAGYGIDRMLDDRLGLIPETFGAVSAGLVVSFGLLAVAAAVKDGIAYIKNKP